MILQSLKIISTKIRTSHLTKNNGRGVADSAKKQIKLSMLMFLLLFSGCYYDSEERLYPTVTSGCDLSNVTFSASVKPILQAACLSCHSNSNANNSGGGIRLENYSDLQTIAKNGKLMGVVKHSSGYQAMPLGGGKLTDCEINTLQTWINNGILNN